MRQNATTQVGTALFAPTMTERFEIKADAKYFKYSFKQASSYSKNNYAYNSVARIFLFYTGQSYCMHVAMEGNLSAEFRKSYVTFTTIRCVEIFFKVR